MCREAGRFGMDAQQAAKRRQNVAGGVSRRAPRAHPLPSLEAGGRMDEVDCMDFVDTESEERRPFRPQSLPEAWARRLARGMGGRGGPPLLRELRAPGVEARACRRGASARWLIRCVAIAGGANGAPLAAASGYADGVDEMDGTFGFGVHEVHAVHSVHSSAREAGGLGPLGGWEGSSVLGRSDRIGALRRQSRVGRVPDYDVTRKACSAPTPANPNAMIGWKPVITNSQDFFTCPT